MEDCSDFCIYLFLIGDGSLPATHVAWEHVEIVGGCVCRLVFKVFVCLLSLIFRFGVSLIFSWCSGYCLLYLIRGSNRLKKIEAV